MTGSGKVRTELHLEGARVLLVEDEMLVSMLIEEVLADQHCVVIGPFDRVPSALAAARQETFDIAVLDVNVAGVKVYPVAEALMAPAYPVCVAVRLWRERRPGRPARLACLPEAVQVGRSGRDADSRTQPGLTPGARAVASQIVRLPLLLRAGAGGT